MSEATRGRGRRVSGTEMAKQVIAGTDEHHGFCGSMCGKNKKAENEDGGKTYQDYLNERGYKPLCCDNTGKDLWTIFPSTSRSCHAAHGACFLNIRSNALFVFGFLIFEEPILSLGASFCPTPLGRGRASA